MAKISALPNAGTITGAEYVAVVQGGVTKKALIADLPTGEGSSDPIAVEEISYTDELGVLEKLPPIKYREAVLYPADFASNVGSCLEPPSADYTIYLRKYEADGSDAGLIGTITIHPDSSFTRATTGGLDVLIDIGEVVLPYGGPEQLGAADVCELLIGVKQ